MQGYLQLWYPLSEPDSEAVDTSGNRLRFQLMNLLPVRLQQPVQDYYPAIDQWAVNLAVPELQSVPPVKYPVRH